MRIVKSLRTSRRLKYLRQNMNFSEVDYMFSTELVGYHVPELEMVFRKAIPVEESDSNSIFSSPDSCNSFESKVEGHEEPGSPVASYMTVNRPCKWDVVSKR